MKEGVIRNIVVGVATAVISALIINFFLYNEKANKPVTYVIQKSHDKEDIKPEDRTQQITNFEIVPSINRNWSTIDGTVNWYFGANGRLKISGQLMGLAATGSYSTNGDDVTGNYTMTQVFFIPTSQPCSFEAIISGNRINGQIACQGEMPAALTLQRAY